MVSFFNPEQIELAAEVTQSFALDNGAFSAWKANIAVDWNEYLVWAGKWSAHPGCDFAVIPDLIEGNENDNDDLIQTWCSAGLRRIGVPVWHLHESLSRLRDLCSQWPRIALGSSGQYADPGSNSWWDRIAQAMEVCCTEEGFPRTKIHGLRMLDPTIFSHIPFSSADSTNVARNIGLDTRWDRSPYAPRSKDQRAMVITDRIEHHGSASRWSGSHGIQQNLELFG